MQVLNRVVSGKHKWSAMRRDILDPFSQHRLSPSRNLDSAKAASLAEVRTSALASARVMELQARFSEALSSAGDEEDTKWHSKRKIMMRRLNKDKAVRKQDETNKRKKSREHYRKALNLGVDDEDRSVLNNRTHGRFGSYHAHDVISVKLLFEEFDPSGNGRIRKKMIYDTDLVRSAGSTAKESFKASSEVLMGLLDNAFTTTNKESLSLEDFLKTVFCFVKHEELHRMLAMLEIYDLVKKFAYNIKHSIPGEPGNAKIQDIHSSNYDAGSSFCSGGSGGGASKPLLRQRSRHSTMTLAYQVPLDIKEELDQVIPY